MANQDISSILPEWTEEFSHALMHNSSLCIALFSGDKKLLFANGSMAELFKGEPAESFLNPTIDEILSFDHSKSLVFEGFLTMGSISSVNTSLWAQVYRKENKILVVGGVNAAQLIQQNDTMHHLNREINNLQRELIREKSTLENTLKKLNELNKELKSLNTDKDRFLRILAHDLKNPFNTLMGFSDLLLKNVHKYDREKIKKQVKSISETTKKTFYLLEDLLLWSNAQSGKLSINKKKAVFEDICMYIISGIENQANSKEISINFFEAEKTILNVDLNMIKTILRNLISNAIKFTEKNGQINIFTEKGAEFITITVSDSGIGISKENIAKLWDFSTQVSTAGTAGERGTGFGLLLCKEFVEKMGGKIWVESEVGKGSDFKFTIPI